MFRWRTYNERLKLAVVVLAEALNFVLLDAILHGALSKLLGALVTLDLAL